MLIISFKLDNIQPILEIQGVIINLRAQWCAIINRHSN